ncbi:hypothetical protein PLANPX_5047 [Lacipirellula parvula]|uniref:Uncharacterized protein n=1 Tax=Lacipirellula parvula TaxID=2650471 RepID=A0A5K7XGB2_9BACT|nr:hypothetical protein PLANPX_5047 [Lacipirellula parvula]
MKVSDTTPPWRNYPIQMKPPGSQQVSMVLHSSRLASAGSRNFGASRESLIANLRRNGEGFPQTPIISTRNPAAAYSSVISNR